MTANATNATTAPQTHMPRLAQSRQRTDLSPTRSSRNDPNSSSHSINSQLSSPRLANHTGLQSPRSDSADRSSIAESARKWRESHSHLFTVNADGSPYVAPGSTLRNEQIEFLRRKKLGPKVAFIDAPDLNESIPDMG